MWLLTHLLTSMRRDAEGSPDLTLKVTTATYDQLFAIPVETLRRIADAAVRPQDR